jgi:deoxyribodipyrimidine photo-lyase
VARRIALASLARGAFAATSPTMSYPEPSRAAGLARLAAITPGLGRRYAEGRNHDPGPGQPQAVSGLSPYLRHRLLTEAETLAAVIGAHGAHDAERFIQEVFWRAYWKGWLEQRPGVWQAYRRDMTPALDVGRSGIACFDAWTEELIETGTLHNHARMWFASIWIFTLGRPWQAGADFFLRHLLDGDAASNTLSWRWVAGLHTLGKHYVARAENIARYTGGRFNPAGLLNEAPAPLAEAAPPPAPIPLPAAPAPPAGEVALLLHEDDLAPESLPLGAARVVTIAGIAVPERRSPAGCAPRVADFTRAALADALDRAARHFGAPAQALAPAELPAWAAAHGRPVVTPWAPVGWTAETLAAAAAAGVALHRLRRDWDSACWPLATAGFFKFRAQIPALLGRLV